MTLKQIEADRQATLVRAGADLERIARINAAHDTMRDNLIRDRVINRQQRAKIAKLPRH